jgi:hypothetical protein
VKKSNIRSGTPNIGFAQNAVTFFVLRIFSSNSCYSLYSIFECLSKISVDLAWAFPAELAIEITSHEPFTKIKKKMVSHWLGNPLISGQWLNLAYVNDIKAIIVDWFIEILLTIQVVSDWGHWAGFSANAGETLRLLNVSSLKWKTRTHHLTR